MPDLLRPIWAITVNQRTMLNKAKQWGYVCESVEFGKLALPEASIGSVARFFSADDTRKIIEAAPEPFWWMQFA